MYKGFTTVHFESLFTLDCNNKSTRGHLAKLSTPRCHKDVRKHFFSHRVINRWNALDGVTVSSSGINAFKSRLNKIKDQDGLLYGLVLISPRPPRRIALEGHPR